MRSICLPLHEKYVSSSLYEILAACTTWDLCLCYVFLLRGILFASATCDLSRFRFVRFQSPLLCGILIASAMRAGMIERLYRKRKSDNSETSDEKYKSFSQARHWKSCNLNQGRAYALSSLCLFRPSFFWHSLLQFPIY